ncbi:MAG TPA: caspase family protein [Methylomirabilota bacterium]|nr:caspase family protein [Methylomirabilota bacterium]
MKTLMRSAPVLLLLALVAGVLEAQPRVERPTYQLGDRWVRSDGAWDLVRVEDDRYVFSSGPGHEMHLTKSLALARWMRGARGFALDPPLELQWPLRVGQVAVAEPRWITPNCPSACTRRVTLSVDKYEDVSVPAGTFRAFKISLESAPPDRARNVWTRMHPGGWVASVVLWYAPELRRYVKMQIDPDFGGRGNSGFSAELLDVDRPAPLTIAFTGLAAGARVDSATLPISGKVTAGRGVSHVVVTLNGAEVLRVDEASNPPKEVPLTAALALREGRNVVLVTAKDAGGETRQEARTIVYEGPGPVAQAPTRGPLSPRGPGAAPRPPLAPVPGPIPGAAETGRRPAPLVSEPPPAATPEPLSPPATTAPPPPPFEVRISSPGDRLRVDHESIALAGVVAGGRGVSQVIVTLNGLEVTRRDEKTPLRTLALNLPLRLRDGQNTLVVTAIDAQGTAQQEVRTVEYARATPLAIAVRFPEDRARLTEESSVVAVVVTSGKGVARVSVTLNGAEVAQQAERTPQTSVVVTTPVTLRPGTNAIVISATDAGGVQRQEVRTVTYDPPRIAAVPPPAAPAPPARQQWAVVIGVGQYESVAVPRLRYTVSDAEAVYQTLIGPAGFKKDNVLLLTDRSDRKPTLRNIKWALGTFLGRSAQKDDTVLIFFAGHGAPEVDTRGLERDGLAKYLIPSDADPDDLYSTALPMDELQTIFGRIEAERVVAFLDACYSGAAGGRTFASKKTRAGAVDDLFLERLTRSKGRAIITASRPAEVSIELPELGHGIFSYYLVSGLKGAADLNRDGIISLQELYEYLEQQVTAKSRSVGGNQHPVMKGELEGVLPLAKVRGR